MSTGRRCPMRRTSRASRCSSSRKAARYLPSRLCRCISVTMSRDRRHGTEIDFATRHESVIEAPCNTATLRFVAMTSKQVLIVEDERPIREMIAFGLKRAGFEVREAEDCRSARAALADARPDLVLVDWMLPDMSGLELTRALKRDRETRELPVIMLTARAEEGDKVAGLEGGADDY